MASMANSLPEQLQPQKTRAGKPRVGDAWAQSPRSRDCWSIVVIGFPSPCMSNRSRHPLYSSPGVMML